ncbi:MAG: hypothetical protein IBJ11_08795 [Phycisphaerales bacterium]|nr:hypothetical protein [Phycisphaerales bacterium]
MALDIVQATRIAEQLLIRQNAAWTVSDAKTLVNWAVPQLASKHDRRQAQAAITATYRIGRVLEHRPGLTRACKWPIETVRSSILESLGNSNAGGNVELLAAALASLVKNQEPTAKPVLDWVEQVNRVIREIDSAATVPQLKDKLLLSDYLGELIERRRRALVTFVEQESQLDCREVASAILEAVRRPAAARDPSAVKESVELRLGPIEIEELCGLVVPTRRREFAEWFCSLSPLAQRAIHRRVSHLATEPLVHSLWVKSIVDPRRPGLRELRVISESVHYRILFHGGPAESPRVLGFGLRRDLERMIEQIAVSA